MRWILILALFFFGVFLHGAGALWRGGKHRIALFSLGLFAIATAIALLVFHFAPSAPGELLGMVRAFVRWLGSLSARGLVILALFLLAVLLSVGGALQRAAGYRAALVSVGTILGASAIAPFLVFSLTPSASSLWLLSALAILLVSVWPVVKGLRPSTVYLNVITLDKVSIPRPGLLRVAHLSDIHLCCEPAMEGALSPDRVRQVAEQALRWALERADFLLLTGDLTDRGSRDEWRNLAMLLAGFDPDKAARILPVPGNHDLTIALEYRNQNDGGLWLAHEEQHRHFATSILGRCPAPWRAGTSEAGLRLSEVFSQAASYIGKYDERPPKLGDPWRSLGTLWRASRLTRARLVADDFAERLAEMVPPILVDPVLMQAASEQAAGSLWPSSRQPLYMDLVRKLYPMVFYEDKRCIFIGLNSNTEVANSILSGAFGLLGEDQLKRLDALLKTSDDRCKIILLHHHIGQPDTPGITASLNRAQMRTLQLRDAAALHAMLSRYKKVLVFHGHKHVGYHASKDGVTVVSAPSVAYGDRNGGSNCFVYEIDPDGEEPRELLRVVETATFTAK